MLAINSAMSYCKSSGPEDKDRVIFLTEEDAIKPSTVKLSEGQPGDSPQGLITQSGEINWECPCLGGMAVGPCGVEFREAFSCFHYSKEEPKGADCLEQFTAMQECMKEYPQLYEKENDIDLSITNGDTADEEQDIVSSSRNDIPVERMAAERSSVSSTSNSPATEKSLVERPSPPPLRQKSPDS